MADLFIYFKALFQEAKALSGHLTALVARVWPKVDDRTDDNPFVFRANAEEKL